MSTPARAWIGGAAGFLLTFLVVHALLPSHRVDAVTVERSIARSVEDVRASTDLVELATDPVPSIPDPSKSAGAEAPRASTTPAETEHPERVGGVLLHGLVTNTRGEPIEQAGLTIQLTTRDRIMTRADALGRYTLGPLSAGTWTVKTWIKNYHDSQFDVDLPHGAEVVRRDVVVQPKQVIRVLVVTSDGRPAIPGLRDAGNLVVRFQLIPIATRDEPGETLDGTFGLQGNKFGVGSFSLAGSIGLPRESDDEFGTLTIHANGPSWISLVAADQVLAKQHVGPEVDVVTFTLDAEDFAGLDAGVRATVIDAETAAPLAAKVWITKNAFPGGRPACETDPLTGVLEIVDTQPGQRWFIVEADGYARLVQRIQLVRGEVLELGELTLHRPVSITGKVVDAVGKPFEAIIRWGVLDGLTGNVTWVAQQRAQSSVDGMFNLPGLEPAIYVVQSPGLPMRPPYPPDATLISLPVRVDTRNGSVSGVTLTLVPTTRITLVSAKTAKPWPFAIAVDSSGLPARRAWLGRYRTESYLDLPQGSYTLEIHRAGSATHREPLVVGSEPQKLEFD